MEHAQRLTVASQACKIAGAYVSNNTIDPDGVLELLHELMKAGEEFRYGANAVATVPAVSPAVPIGESINTDYIVCLEDGRRFKSLRLHLSRKYNMSPDEYRARWGLSPQYPMVAPGYAKVRSEIAKVREQQKRERLTDQP
jgi:predicted transcriptional regulator